MKTKDIAKQYHFDVERFEWFCSKDPSIGLSSNEIPDSNVNRAVESFQQYQREQRAKGEKNLKEMAELNRKASEIAAEKVRKEQEKQAAMASMLITSGFSFDGYTITKYSGYISGDDATQIPRSGVFGGNNGKNLTDALVKIRIQALKELKEAAYDLGCNAVIGVDFDYITLEPQTANITGGTLYEPYIICVTANGNAVVIEKNTNESS